MVAGAFGNADLRGCLPKSGVFIVFWFFIYYPNYGLKIYSLKMNEIHF